MSEFFTDDEVDRLEDAIKRFPVNPDAIRYNQFISQMTNPDNALKHLDDVTAMIAENEMLRNGLGWVELKKRDKSSYPEIGKEVMVTNGKELWFDYWSPGGDEDWPYWNSMSLDITHWMEKPPLPTPPE